MTEKLIELLESAHTATVSGNHAMAVQAFEQVHALLPTDVTIALALANALVLHGKKHQSRETLHQAFRHGDWSDPKVAFALGTALLDDGACHDARVCFEHTVRAFPNDAAAHGALAAALRGSAKPDAAWHHAERALALSPKTPALLLTAAQVRHDLRDFPRALSLVDRALALRPGHGPTILQRAFTTLIQGATTQGWHDYESRALPVPPTSAKVWNGEPLHGQSILVTAEQGVGDQFQFCRFIGALRERGASRVLVECHADAVSLFTASGFDAVARGCTQETDWHVPMASLPHRLQAGADTYSHLVPYLAPPPDQTPVNTLRPNTGSPASPPRRFGVVWAGNPDFTGRELRHLDPELLTKLVGIPGIEWVSLQVGAAAQLAPQKMTSVTLTSDWGNTAALLKSLDGLVTVDTGTAHLAGAMGVPAWVLLSYVPDWRWGTEGTQSVWYPSVRLIRQIRPGDWESTISQLAEELS